MTSNIKWLAVAGGLSSALVIAITATANAATATTPPSVIAMSQSVQNGEVTLDYAYLPANGYAVIYADENGKPSSAPLGSVELKAGDHRFIKVKLSSKPDKGDRLWVSLYSDKDSKPGFDRKGDASFWSGGLPPINQITVQ